MNQKIFEDIKSIARDDFKIICRKLQSDHSINASLKDVKFVNNKDVVTATFDINIDTLSDSTIEAAINYSCKGADIFSDSSISDISEAIYSAIGTTAITAADEDENDAFVFDENFEEESFKDEGSTSSEEDMDMFEDEFEDPEDEPSIETDNNIAGHYIVECDRCHGIFISALMESDQQVEYLTGTCPLCEKESDQYIKWVVHPVEF